MIRVIAIGKIKEKASKMMCEEYIKRISGYTKIECIEVDDEMAPEKLSDAQKKMVMDKEAERVLKKVKDRDYMILLDLHGKSVDSEKLASKINDIYTYHASDIAFVIGGSLGVSELLIQRSNFRWKLSDLTLPHQLCRIFVLEQIFRSYKILNNETYHK